MPQPFSAVRPSTASGLCLGLLLAACGDGNAPSQPSTPPQIAEAAAPRETNDRPPSSPAPASPPTPPATPAEPTPGTLPLTPGVYVLAGEDCARPANAGFRVFNGRGISGSATRDCRATIRSRDGDAYQVEQSCVETYSGDRVAARQTIRTTDARSFTLTEEGEGTASRFRLCPAGTAPSYLEDLARAG